MARVWAPSLRMPLDREPPPVASQSAAPGAQYMRIGKPREISGRSSPVLREDKVKQQKDLLGSGSTASDPGRRWAPRAFRPEEHTTAKVAREAAGHEELQEEQDTPAAPRGRRASKPDENSSLADSVAAPPVVSAGNRSQPLQPASRTSERKPQDTPAAPRSRRTSKREESDSFADGVAASPVVNTTSRSQQLAPKPGTSARNAQDTPAAPRGRRTSKGEESINVADSFAAKPIVSLASPPQPMQPASGMPVRDAQDTPAAPRARRTSKGEECSNLAVSFAAKPTANAANGSQPVQPTSGTPTRRAQDAPSAPRPTRNPAREQNSSIDGGHEESTTYGTDKRSKPGRSEADAPRNKAMDAAKPREVAKGKARGKVKAKGKGKGKGKAARERSVADEDAQAEIDEIIKEGKDSAQVNSDVPQVGRAADHESASAHYGQEHARGGSGIGRHGDQELSNVHPHVENGPEDCAFEDGFWAAPDARPVKQEAETVTQHEHADKAYETGLHCESPTSNSCVDHRSAASKAATVVSASDASREFPADTAASNAEKVVAIVSTSDAGTDVPVETAVSTAETSDELDAQLSEEGQLFFNVCSICGETRTLIADLGESFVCEFAGESCAVTVESRSTANKREDPDEDCNSKREAGLDLRTQLLLRVHDERMTTMEVTALLLANGLDPIVKLGEVEAAIQASREYQKQQELARQKPERSWERYVDGKAVQVKGGNKFIVEDKETKEDKAATSVSIRIVGSHTGTGSLKDKKKGPRS